MGKTTTTCSPSRVEAKTTEVQEAERRLPGPGGEGKDGVGQHKVAVRHGISLIPSFHIVFIYHTIIAHATIIIYPKNFKDILDLLFASTSSQKTGEQWTQSFQG